MSSYDFYDHRCVNQDKVNSLVRNLETMKNEKSDLKMAVYKQYDSLGEQFTDILCENNSNGHSSACCITPVPMRSQLTQQIYDDPDAMKRAQIALEDLVDADETARSNAVIAQQDLEDCVTARRKAQLTQQACFDLDDCVIAVKKTQLAQICDELEDCVIERKKAQMARMCNCEKHQCMIEKYEPCAKIAVTLNDILGVNNSCEDSSNSCGVVPIQKGDTLLQDCPEAMRRAESALHSHAISPVFDQKQSKKDNDFQAVATGVNQKQSKKDNNSQAPPVVFDQTQSKKGKNPQVLVPTAFDRNKVKKDDPIALIRKAREMIVNGAVGGRARHVCNNCSSNEVSEESRSILCNECQLYEKQHNKPRPSALRENNCLHCCATIWIEDKMDEILYCDSCKCKLLSIVGKSIGSIEYEQIRVGCPIVLKTATEKPETEKKVTKESLSYKVHEFMDVEPIIKKIDPIKFKEQSKFESVVQNKVPKETPSVKTKEALAEEGSLKTTPPAKQKESMEVELDLKKKTLFTELPVKAKEPLLADFAIKKEVKQPINQPVYKKLSEIYNITAEEKESMELNSDVQVKMSVTTKNSFTSPSAYCSSRALSVDYGGEQCCDSEDINPFNNKKKGTMDCVHTRPESNDRFALRGVIKNQSYDQTEQAREGTSSVVNEIPERKTSDENLHFKKSNDSFASSGVASEAELAPPKPDYFQRNDSSVELEADVVRTNSTSPNSNRYAIEEKGVESNEDLETVERSEKENKNKEKEKEKDKKCNRDENSKDRYCFEEIETYPAFSDKLY